MTIVIRFVLRIAWCKMNLFAKNCCKVLFCSIDIAFCSIFDVLRSIDVVLFSIGVVLSSE